MSEVLATHPICSCFSYLKGASCIVPPRIWKVRYLRLVRKVQRALRHPRLRHRQWWKPILQRLLDRRLWLPCRDTVAGGMAIGLFFSMMFMPGQMIAAALVAARSRVNIPFAAAACWITNPITGPFIRLTQLKFGHWLRDSLGIPMPSLGSVELEFGETVIPLNVSDFILGFLISGVLLGLIAYPLVHLFSAAFPLHLPIRKDRGIKASEKDPQNSSNHTSLPRTARPDASPR